ncbi:hypothetical protein L5M38_23470 [Shewanella sp. SM101]|nr:hypothetical protein [Shewanella sp. SM101]AEH16249.1 hypothetical protein Sbal117_4611 [Shewanella baltica OS117]MCU8008972.1 hypothetical protein [Shewanella sp. SM87]MCU8107454.1 hypothetical protein [Shewanella sp. SM101]
MRKIGVLRLALIMISGGVAFNCVSNDTPAARASNQNITDSFTMGYYENILKSGKVSDVSVSSWEQKTHEITKGKATESMDIWKVETVIITKSKE